jgi:hypothetical protein
LKVFVNTLKQDEAIDLLSASAREILLYGGARSGKTAILVKAMIIRACKTRSRHVILRLNFNHVIRTIFHETFPKVLELAFPDIKVKYNKTLYYCSFKNGSEIFFGGLDDKERTEKILGSEYSTIYFNESSQIPYASIQIAKTRLAEKNSLTKKIYYDANPPTKSHWLYPLFMKKLDPIDNIPIYDPENYESLLMNPMHNLENIDADYLKLLEAMPEKERNRFLSGLFADESDGQVYYSFRREVHVKPLTREPGTLFIFEDFNVDPGTAIIAQFINNKICCLDEVFLPNSDTYKMVDEFNKKNCKGASIIPDSTGRSRKTSGKSDFVILEDGGYRVLDTRNPFVGDRVNNVNRLFQASEIIIDPKCKKLINDLEKVVWKNNELDQSGVNKHLTHISDSLGYGCWKLKPMILPKEQRTIQL